MASIPTVRTATCIVCGRKVVSGKRGKTREIHEDCKPLHDALVRLDKALENLGDLNLKPSALVELRYRLVCASTSIPRPRDAQGRFLKRVEY